MLKTPSVARVGSLLALILYLAGLIQMGFALSTMWQEQEYVAYALSHYITPLGLGFLIFIGGFLIQIMATAVRYLGWMVQLKASGDNDVDVPEFSLYLARLKKLRLNTPNVKYVSSTPSAPATNSQPQAGQTSKASPKVSQQNVVAAATSVSTAIANETMEAKAQGSQKSHNYSSSSNEKMPSEGNLKQSEKK